MRIHIATLIIGFAAAASAADGPVVFEMQIHPGLDAESCGRLPEPARIPEERDFSRAVERGWVTLTSHSFDDKRELWPCMQQVRVEFPSPELYREFAGAMTACPQYPFYSGADYLLQTRIFERTAETRDVAMLQILLAKDARCASELNPPLYALLRRDPKAFLSAFAQLDPEQQKRAAESQYDFNVPLGEQQFSQRAIAALPEPLRPTALQFNELLAARAATPAPPEAKPVPDAP